MTPLLSVKGLSKHYTRAGAKFAAVDGVSFDCYAGETVALVGPSGSGKSTIARLLLRLIEPDGGAVLFDGADWLNLSPAQLRAKRRDMQIVFQNPDAALNPRSTVRDMLKAPLRIHGIVPKREVDGRVDMLLDRVGLRRDLADRYPHELSGGQKQRIAIARAIATEPKLIVLDEATSALDSTVRAGILDLLRQLQRDLGVTYLMIAHDLALVQATAHRIVVLNRGQIAEQGQTANVIADPKSPTTLALLDAALHLPLPGDING